MVQSIDLKSGNIAIQNAVTGGDAVYMARAMLQLDVEDDVSIFRKAKNNLQHTENVSLTIYPNPTNGKINLEYDVPVQSKAEIKIYNVLGTVVETYDLNNKGNLLSIELKNNLGNILFYRFYVNDTLIDKGKIIYIK
ncbi:MAG: T9SS type A sorting domain-containing protein [Bacteroidetes bacterium]|nr:T9SS type A sorting domain-containing protein [Bacteroidota bacterium]MBL0052928.1 T9SS type A sorting domain-containing protein [Bacteroidota bacterium]